MTQRSRRQTDTVLLRRLACEVRPYWGGVTAILLLSLATTPLSLLAPVPIKIAVDSVLGSAPLPAFLGTWLPARITETVDGRLAAAAGLLVVVAISTYLLALVIWALQAYIAEKMTLSFRAKLFYRAQQLSLEHHDRMGTADTLYRIQYDAPALHTFVVNALIPIAAGGTNLAAMLFVTALIDLPMALVALVIVPALYAFTTICRRRLRAHWLEFKQDESRALSTVHEAMSALRIVKAFGHESRERDRFIAQSQRLVSGQARLALIEGSYDFLVGLTLALGTAAVLMIGVWHVQANALSIGDLLLIMGYLAQLYRPLETISRKIAELQGSLASFERACALADRALEVADRPDARPLGRAHGAITFRNVSFHYSDRERVLDRVSFQAPLGASLGIIGTTGTGKSTIAGLLMRFYDPKEGTILLDGVDLRNYRLSDLRRQFALVLQEPVLLSTTIAENIAYGRPAASRADIEAVAKAANAHEFIVRLPDGYGTQVGERGMRLSGGERQRVALARALLRNAPILILDEPTSAVDKATEDAIIDSLQRLKQGCTVFVITHRPSVLRICDSVLRLEAGKLLEIDRHSTDSERVASAG